MADSSGADQRSYKDRRADKKARRDLKNLQLDDDSEPEDDRNDGDYTEAWESMKTTSNMAPPTRQSSRRPSATGAAPTRQSSRRPSAAGADHTSKPSSSTSHTRKPSASGASHTRKPSSSTPAHARNSSSSKVKIPPTDQLPPGVTSEMVMANLDRIERDRARQEQLFSPHHVPRPDLQVDIKPETLPCGLSVFCNDRTVTRELLFNISRLDCLDTIKKVLNNHFAYEFKRIALPKDVYFAGINIAYHKSSHKEDVRTFGTIVTDGEYQLTMCDIMDGKTTTGQLVRVQVMLYTDKQLAAEQPQVKEWFASGEHDVIQSINGIKWLLEYEDIEKRKIDTRIFELDQEDRGETITAPARIWRENKAKAERGDMITDHLSEVYKAKANIRNKEHDIRKEMIAEMRGLRRMLRKETGRTDIKLEEVLSHANESEKAELRGRQEFPGERQDWVHLKELRKEVEDKSDQYAAMEGGAFDRAFGRI